ncbi:MAG: hypothetical protein AAFU85_20470, partial [Planctomycetota bacterium]
MKTACQIVFLSALLAIVGCSTQPDAESGVSDQGSGGATIQSAAELNAAGETPEIGEDAFSPSDTTPLDDLGRSADATRRSRTGSSLAPPPGDAVGTSIPSMSGLPVAEVPAPPGEPDVRQPTILERKLRSDLTPEELERFLEHADRELSLIASGRAGEMSQAEAIQLMR